MGYCPNFNGIIKAYTQDGIVLARVRCKQWSCPHCAEINRHMWYIHIMRGIDALIKSGDYPLILFATFTAHESAHKAQDKAGASIKNLRQPIKKLLDRLRLVAKRAGGNLEYVRVYEAHYSGAIHAHMLVFMPDTSEITFTKRGVAKLRQRDGKFKRFKDVMRRYGAGYMVDVKRVRSDYHAGQVVAYVTKYLTKSAQDIPVKGLRRIVASRAFGAIANMQDDSEYDWQISIGVSVDEYLQMLGKDKFVYDLNLDKVVTMDDYLGKSNVYPPLDWDGDDNVGVP